MDTLTKIELSRSAFHHNINSITEAAGNAEIALVIKSNAYGHGAHEIVQLAEENNHISWYCMAGLQQAIELKKSGTQKTVLALSFLDANLEEAVAAGIHMMVYTLEDALAISNAAQHVGKQAFVHIKIDTGMCRLGIQPYDALLFIRALQLLPHLHLYGIATHLSDTPNPDQRFSREQLRSLEEVRELCKGMGINFAAAHAQSSSALAVPTEHRYTHIRVGAAAYGIWKSEEHKSMLLKHHPALTLQPVMVWKTKIIQLKKAPAGSQVGYDRTFVTKRPSVLAVAPIGYWDGYPRSLSNKGHALIHNQLAPIAGIVSMNIATFDVTDIPEAQLHDEIILLGDAPGIRAYEVAQTAKLIANEIITHINPSIERAIVEQHMPYPIQPLTGSNEPTQPANRP
jgi:alanine racemase